MIRSSSRRVCLSLLLLTACIHSVECSARRRRRRTGVASSRRQRQQQRFQDQSEQQRQLQDPFKLTDVCGAGVFCRNNQVRMVQRYTDCFGDGGIDSPFADALEQDRKKEVRKFCRKEFKGSFLELANSCPPHDFFVVDGDDSTVVANVSVEENMQIDANPMSASTLPKSYRKRRKSLIRSGNDCMKQSLFETEWNACAVERLQKMVCGPTNTDQRAPPPPGGIVPIRPCPQDLHVCPDGTTLRREGTLDCEFPSCP